QVVLVTRAGREWDVERRRAAFTGPAAAGIERPLVHRGEEDRVVVAEDLLGAVAVVDVPIDDRHAPDPELGLGLPRSDRDVVEQAEAHRATGQRVVAGRADEREAAPRDGPARATGREARAPPPRA